MSRPGAPCAPTCGLGITASALRSTSTIRVHRCLMTRYCSPRNRSGEWRSEYGLKYTSIGDSGVLAQTLLDTPYTSPGFRATPTRLLRSDWRRVHQALVAAPDHPPDRERCCDEASPERRG